MKQKCNKTISTLSSIINCITFILDYFFKSFLILPDKITSENDRHFTPLFLYNFFLFAPNSKYLSPIFVFKQNNRFSMRLGSVFCPLYANTLFLIFIYFVKTVYRLSGYCHVRTYNDAHREISYALFYIIFKNTQLLHLIDDTLVYSLIFQAKILRKCPKA